MDRTGPVPPDHPVCHVCYHEAEAYARWAGKRLPTEPEWEIAASWESRHPPSRAGFPGATRMPKPELAAIDQLAFGTAPVGAFPRNVSALGCYGLIGDVWEWTASDFHGYPGFAAFPYPEYSRGLLRRRVQGAARRVVGHATRRDPHHVPKLGLPHPPPDLQPASGAPRDD